jgi:hypothetical protein
MEFKFYDPDGAPPSRPATSMPLLSASVIAVPPYAATLLHLDFGEETVASSIDEHQTASADPPK